MGGFIDDIEAKILDDFTKKTAYTPPTTWYCALSTTTPTDAGANFTEPTGGYVRFPFTAATWTTATTGDPASTSYGAWVTFPIATGGWGTVTHFGMFTVATTSTGTVQFWGTLSAAKGVQTNDQLVFTTNQLFLKLGDPTDAY